MDAFLYRRAVISHLDNQLSEVCKRRRIFTAHNVDKFARELERSLLKPHVTRGVCQHVPVYEGGSQDASSVLGFHPGGRGEWGRG